jgi:3-phosphoshikimate 1-carboxyvinyltransferase
VRPLVSRQTPVFRLKSSSMIIRPARRIRGRISLPGDKSISHRAAMIAAIANGASTISNFATSQDCASTLSCLRGLGVQIEHNGTDVVVKGIGKRGLKPPNQPLDCGNSGTTMRLLSGILAGQDFESVLIGDESLQSRPMKRVIDPLTLMGATIGSTEGRAPLTISGSRQLEGIIYEPPVSSAQVKSAVLLAGLFANGDTKVIEAAPTRDHTERMLELFGAAISVSGNEIMVSAKSSLVAQTLQVPGDVSSAAFFAVAAATLEGSDLTMESVGVNPSRTAAIEFLRGSGVAIELHNERLKSGEPVADFHITGNLPLRSSGPSNIDGPLIANLIDEIPILAVYGTQLENGLEIRDAKELRVKESDRIRSVVTNLRRMGADVEEFDDGMKIGKSSLKGARVESFGDHRIAMAFAIAGLLADGGTEIHESECVDVSFPGFFDSLEGVVER